MKLVDDIYVIDKRDENDGKYIVDIKLNIDSNIYKGHFPGNPITPGVVIIGIARELIESITGQQLKLKKVSSVKYSAVLSPLEHSNVTYSIDLSQIADTFSAKVTVLDNATVFCRMNILLGPNPAII